MNDRPAPQARVLAWIVLAVLGGIFVSGAFATRSEGGNLALLGAFGGHTVFIAGWAAWGPATPRWRTNVTFAWPTVLIVLYVCGMFTVVGRWVDPADLLRGFVVLWCLFMVPVGALVVILLLARLYLGLTIGVPTEASHATSQFPLRQLFLVTTLVALGLGLARLFFANLALGNENRLGTICFVTGVLAWGIRSVLFAGVLLLPRAAWLTLLVAAGVAGLATGVEAIGWSMMPNVWREPVTMLALAEVVSSLWILAHVGLARWQGYRLIPDPRRLEESRLLDWVRVATGVQWRASGLPGEASPLDEVGRSREDR